MLLAVNIGNTNIVMGVYNKDDLILTFRLSTKTNRTSDEICVFIYNLLVQNKISPGEIDGVIVASVVPDIMYTFLHAIRKCFSLIPMLVGPGIKTGINIKIDNPKELGADLIVNAVAAFERYKDSCIVIDFGTATTFSVVSKNCEHLGVCISPGIKISADALFLNTAKLPKVELVLPQKVIGKNTVASMQSGIILGIIGQVKYIVEKISEEMISIGENKPHVIATGGMSTLVSRYGIDVIEKFEPLLTLEGLKIIYKRNIER
ncbi:MAG: type III pantothenate kinase [Oscillospiraceae bacterium]|nr:type III pantothenate kinase [Oscillospiraceae bacterium]